MMTGKLVPIGMVLAVGLVVAHVWTKRRGIGTVSGNGKVLPYSERDVDYLARMLIAETSFARDREEMAGIVWVAINRILNRAQYPWYNYNTLADVVQGTAWKGGEATYDRNFWGAQNNPRFEAAKQFVRDVLDGRIPNPVGGRAGYYHHGTVASRGDRPPRWGVAKSQGGTAVNEPLIVGGATFAGLGRPPKINNFQDMYFKSNFYAQPAFAGVAGCGCGV